MELSPNDEDISGLCHSPLLVKMLVFIIINMYYNDKTLIQFFLFTSWMHEDESVLNISILVIIHSFTSNLLLQNNNNYLIIIRLKLLPNKTIVIYAEIHCTFCIVLLYFLINSKQYV